MVMQGRFLEEFGVQEGEEGDTAGQGTSKKAEQAGPGLGKPAEHEVLFSGNCDDHFRLGIKVTRYAASQMRCSRPDLQRCRSAQETGRDP